MHTVTVAVVFLAGASAGLFAIGRYPSGLDPLYGWVMLGLGAGAAVPLIIGRNDRRLRATCIFVMAALLGCGRALLIHPPVTPNDLAYYNGDEGAPSISVTGRIVGEPVYGDRSQRVRLEAETIRTAGALVPKEVSGDLIAILPRYPEFSPGERLVLVGRLTPPPDLGNFDYPAYLARQGVYSYMSFPRTRSLGPGETTGLAELLAASRVSVRNALRQTIPEPQAALAVGIVTGDRSSIPSEIREAFLRSGTIHIMAISGQNIALLIGVIWLAYGRKGSRRRMPLWLLFLVYLLLAGYTAFTGANPPVVRAFVMGAVLLAAPVVGRRDDPVAGLSLTAAVMALLDPDVLLDTGFLLSFSSMLGIVFLSGHFYAFLKRIKVPRLLALQVATSTGAQLATIPLGAFLTGRVPLVAIPASITTDISLPPLMVPGIAAGILGWIWPPLAVPLGTIVWLSASWMLAWVQFWGSLPWASIDSVVVKLSWIVLYYAVGGTALWLLGSDTRRRLVLQRVGPVPRGSLLLGMLALLTSLAALALLLAG